MIEKYARAVELSAHRIERLKRQNAVQKIVIGTKIKNRLKRRKKCL